MRKALLFILTFIISLSINADGISVVGFKLLDTDLTANTRGTSKLDQNGNVEETSTATTNLDGKLEMANLYAEKVYTIEVL